MFTRLTRQGGERVFYDALHGSSANIFVSLEGPDGALVSGFGDRSNRDIGPLRLAEPGTYRLVVDAQGDVTGDYEFRLLDAGASQQVALGETVSVAQLVGFETNLFQIDGAAGRNLFFEALATSATSGQWRLFGPDDQFLRGAPVGADFTQQLPGAGRYVLVVGNDSATPLSYDLRVTDLGDGEGGDGEGGEGEAGPLDAAAVDALLGGY